MFLTYFSGKVFPCRLWEISTEAPNKCHCEVFFSLHVIEVGQAIENDANQAGVYNIISLLK